MTQTINLLCHILRSLTVGQGRVDDKWRLSARNQHNPARNITKVKESMNHQVIFNLGRWAVLAASHLRRSLVAEMKRCGFEARNQEHASVQN